MKTVKPTFSIIWAIIIVFLSLLSFQNIEKDNIQLIPHVDKIIHTFMYFILSFLLSYELKLSAKTSFLRIIYVFISCSVFGTIMEILQLFSVYRTTDFIDVLFNISGTIIGITAYYTYKHFK